MDTTKAEVDWLKRELAEIRALVDQKSKHVSRSTRSGT